MKEKIYKEPLNEYNDRKYQYTSNILLKLMVDQEYCVWRDKTNIGRKSKPS
jgi:hypothetical protein